MAAVFLAAVTLAIFSMCSSASAKTVAIAANATSYGLPNGTGTEAGACGYTNLLKTTGYGFNTASVSVALWNGGLACGACYSVRCDSTKTKYCNSTKPIYTTVTNFCPAAADNFCTAPKTALALPQNIFFKIAKVGLVPVIIQQVACNKTGFVNFKIQTGSNPYFLLVLVGNTAGSGALRLVEISLTGGKSWLNMTHNYGANWSITNGQSFLNQTLSFRLTASRTKEIIVAPSVAPAKWVIGSTYLSKVNFKVAP